MSGRQPYVRPVEAYWWLRPPYLAYTLREATGVAIAGYALVLLTGVVCLARGEAAYNAWLAFLASPWSLGLHLAFLIAVVAHVVTWFTIMPKTMPRIVLAGRYLEQHRITILGLSVAIVTNLALLLTVIVLSE